MRKYLVLAYILALVLTYWAGRVFKVRAQTTAPWQVGVSSATHTSCTVVTGTTQYCFASDGLWVSLNGAAYVQVQTGTPVAAGVTSFNGLTGAVTYTPPVVSVNGKTGSVILSIQ